MTVAAPGELPDHLPRALENELLKEAGDRFLGQQAEVAFRVLGAPLASCDFAATGAAHDHFCRDVEPGRFDVEKKGRLAVLGNAG